MTIKACVFGALACVFAASSALAADLPSVKGAPAYAPPPVFTWDGWHIGVVGGYGGGASNSSATVWGFAPLGVFVANSTAGTSGWLIGYESGYTWQFANNLVVGYESEFSYADVRSGSGAFGGANTRLQWFGAERLRFGYAMGHFLPYVTGGLAYGQLRAEGVDFLGGFAFPNNASTWQAGWTVGAGLEYAIMGNVSIKAEYLFTHMKGLHGFGGGAPSSFRTFDGRDFDTHLARVGVNFHFADFGSLLNTVGLRF